MKDHKVHAANLYAIILLQYITVKILLKTVMDIRSIGKMLKTIETVGPRVSLSRFNLVATLPVIYFISTVGTFADKVHCSGDTCFGIIHTPFGTERLERHITFKCLEIVPLTGYIDSIIQFHIITTVRDIT